MEYTERLKQIDADIRKKAYELGADMITNYLPRINGSVTGTPVKFISE